MATGSRAQAARRGRARRAQAVAPGRSFGLQRIHLRGEFLDRGDKVGDQRDEVDRLIVRLPVLADRILGPGDGARLDGLKLVRDEAALAYARLPKVFVLD